MTKCELCKEREARYEVCTSDGKSKCWECFWLPIIEEVEKDFKEAQK